MNLGSHQPRNSSSTNSMIFWWVCHGWHGIAAGYFEDVDCSVGENMLASLKLGERKWTQIQGLSNRWKYTLECKVNPVGIQLCISKVHRNAAKALLYRIWHLAPGVWRAWFAWRLEKPESRLHGWQASMKHPIICGWSLWHDIVLLWDLMLFLS